MKNKKMPVLHKLPKKAIRIILIALLLFVVSTTIVLIVIRIEQAPEAELHQQYLDAAAEPLPTYTYIYDVDYDLNIFDDVSYMKLDRGLYYSDGPQSLYIALDDTSAVALDQYETFFLRYFSDVVNGNTDDYALLFDASYFDDSTNMKIPDEPFTMQKLYDIHVEKKTMDANGATFLVYYKIMDNNGSFRDDIRDGEIRELAFTVKKADDGIRISQIKPYIRLE